MDNPTTAQKNPIIILGFGRSGTTWISDIVSKSLGGLILFEPFHPEVFEHSKECCYHNGSDASIIAKVQLQIDEVLTKKNSNKWLIRNHLPTTLNETCPTLVNKIWDNCDITGYKAIRQNLMIPYLYQNVSERIVFVKRDMLSVLASLVRRKRFWEEYGFDFHESKFIKEVFDTEMFSYLNKNGLLELYKSLDQDFLKMAFIWVVTHEIAERDLKELGLPIFSYEEFYETPYKATFKLLDYLGHSDIKPHPTAIFAPSKLTFREFNRKNMEGEIDTSHFWKDTFSKEQIDDIFTLKKQIINLVTPSVSYA